MTLKNETANTLIVLSIFIFIFSFVVISPTAQFFGFIFAGFWMIFPLLFGEKKYQIIAGCILTLCSLLSFNAYPAFYKDYHGYFERTKSKQK